MSHHRKKAIGYVVLDRFGALALCVYPDEKVSVLLHGGGATVFATRDQARTAMKRTVKFAEARGYAWSHIHDHSIVRLTQ